MIRQIVAMTTADCPILVASAHDVVVRIARDLELRETAWRRRFGTAAIGAG